MLNISLFYQFARPCLTKLSSVDWGGGVSEPTRHQHIKDNGKLKFPRKYSFSPPGVSSLIYLSDWKFTMSSWWNLSKNYLVRLKLCLEWVSVISRDRKQSIYLLMFQSSHKRVWKSFDLRPRTIWRTYAVKPLLWGSCWLSFTPAWKIPEFGNWELQRKVSK